MSRKGKRGKTKKVPSLQAVSTTKRAVKDDRLVQDAEGNFHKTKPRWCFRRFDAHDWASELDPGQKSQPEAFDAVARFLHEMSKLTWGEIKQGNHGLRRLSEFPASTLSAVNARLKALNVADDLDGDLFRFRLKGKQRLWGYIDDSDFVVLWWDPEHQVWPTDKD